MLNKTVIEVPKGVRYLSQWEDFKLSNFPDKCIINKQLPGCGFTEYSLTSEDENNVVCSPRKTLIENKKNQHPDTIYLVVNDYEQEELIDFDMSSKSESAAVSDSAELDEKEREEGKKKSRGKEMYDRLFKEISEYIHQMDMRALPYKIEVTYDSFRLVRDILVNMNILQDFYVIVDEMQSVLDDSRFKPDTEIEFLSVLSTVPKTLFVSATPMLDECIELLPEFKDLPYFEFDWRTQDPVRIHKPNLKIRTMESVRQKAGEIIQEYLEGDFEKALVERNGELVEVISNEATLFVNSVNHIISIIKKTKLQPDQVNILCARNNRNKKLIQRKLGKRFDIGTVPLKGEQHKMFTFCTRTVYLGADFYSLCARSFIFSDANSDCLSVDISMDLPQILGRQRLDENPWKNSANFYYRAKCDWKNMTDEDFQRLVKKKIEMTQSLLRSYDKADDGLDKFNLANVYLERAKARKYKSDYVGINRHDISGTIKPKLNNLVYVNDLRTFQIQQKDYADRFSIFTKIREEIGYVGKIHDGVDEFFNEYNSYTTYVDRMKLLCEYAMYHSENEVDAVIANLQESDKIRQHFLGLGPKRIMELHYNSGKINKELGIIIFDRGKLDGVVVGMFMEGDKYTKKDLKVLVGEIYKKVGYTPKPKATDLEEWFELRSCKVTTDEGKREHAFQIGPIKDKYKDLYNLSHT